MTSRPRGTRQDGAGEGVSVPSCDALPEASHCFPESQPLTKKTRQRLYEVLAEIHRYACALPQAYSYVGLCIMETFGDLKGRRASLVADMDAAEAAVQPRYSDKRQKAGRGR